MVPFPVTIDFANGLVFVVSQKTFAWCSFNALAPRSDARVMVAVTVITVFTDQAIAAVTGMVIFARVIAWQPHCG